MLPRNMSCEILMQTHQYNYIYVFILDLVHTVSLMKMAVVAVNNMVGSSRFVTLNLQFHIFIVFYEHWCLILICSHF